MLPLFRVQSSKEKGICLFNCVLGLYDSVDGVSISVNALFISVKIAREAGARAYGSSSLKLSSSSL